MMNVGRCAVIGRWFDPAQQLFADSPDPARLRGALAVALSVLALLSSAARSEPSVVADAAIEAPSDPLKTDVAKQSLPPRALLRMSTDNLRTQSFITAIAFSPDGRLVAAGDANAPSPQVAIFDVPSGRQVKQIVAPGKREGGVGSVAFSPDSTKLLWGEFGGEVALWDLTVDRLTFRQKLHSGEVADVEFSPDGSLMASAGGDVIRLRRVTNPTEVSPAPGPLQSHSRRRRPHAGDLGSPTGWRPRQEHRPPVRHRVRRAGPHARARGRSSLRDGVLTGWKAALHRIRYGVWHCLGCPCRAGKPVVRKAVETQSTQRKATVDNTGML
jgi:WD domain, G-beta repeat